MAIDKRRQSTLLGLVWATGFFLVLIATVSLPQFHVDEIITFNVAQMNVAEIAANRLQATHSPIYFWLVKPIAFLDGPPYLLRLPSVLFCAIGLGVLVRTLCLHFDARFANILGFGLATSPGWIYIAHYARPYALLLMLFAFCICSMVAILRPRLEGVNGNGTGYQIGRAPWIWLSVSATAANTLMMAGVLHSVTLAILPFFDSRLRRDRKFIRAWLLAMAPVLASAAIVSLLLFTSIVERADAQETGRSIAFSLERVLRVSQIVFVSPVTPGTIESIILICVAVLLASVVFFRNRYTSLIRSSLPLGIGVPLILVLVSLKTNLLLPRYFYLTTPAWCVLAAIGAREFWRNSWSALVPLVLLVTLPVQVWHIFGQDDVRNHAMKRFADFVVDSNSMPDVIVPASDGPKYSLKFIFRHEHSVEWPIRVVDRPEEEEKLVALVADLTERYPQVWLVGDFTQAEIDTILGFDDALASCSMKRGLKARIIYRKNRPIELSRMPCRRNGPAKP